MRTRPLPPPPPPRRSPRLLAGAALLALAVGAPAATTTDDELAPLSLREALTQALEESPSLKVSALDPDIAGAVLERERAAWDARVEADVDRNETRVPVTSNIEGIRVRQTDDRVAELRVVKPDPGGGSLEAAVTQAREATNSQRAILNPAYSNRVRVSYTRPLLRGRGRDATRRDVGLAEVDLEVSRWRLRGDVLDILAATERAYWNLASARERVDVARINLREAETLLERSRFRVEAGTLAGVALVEAEAAVAERRDLLLLAEREEQLAHNALVDLVDPPARPGFGITLLEDSPGSALPEVPAFDQLVGLALLNSPAYRIALADLRARKVQLAFTRDAFLPRLDLVASMSANGVAGGTRAAIEESASLDFPSYFVGLRFGVPIGRRAARAESRRRELELERSLRAVKALELSLEGTLTDLRQRYRTDLLRRDVSLRRVEAAEAKLEAEEGRFEGGLITADDLLRFQGELATARASEVAARVQASISAMELWRIAGTLLERRGVTVDPLGLPDPILLDEGAESP